MDDAQVLIDMLKFENNKNLPFKLIIKKFNKMTDIN